MKSFSLQKNAHGATNTGNFVVTYADEPDWTDQLLQNTFGGNSNLSPVYVEIWAGFPDNPGTLPSTSGLSRHFYGVLDVYDPDHGRSRVAQPLNGPLRPRRNQSEPSEGSARELAHRTRCGEEVRGRLRRARLKIAMQESTNEFKSPQAVLDAIQAAREVQERAWETWFAVRDVDSDEFESARLAYTGANLEINRLIEIYKEFRRRQ